MKGFSQFCPLLFRKNPIFEVHMLHLAKLSSLTMFGMQQWHMLIEFDIIIELNTSLNMPLNSDSILQLAAYYCKAERLSELNKRSNASIHFFFEIDMKVGCCTAPYIVHSQSDFGIALLVCKYSLVNFNNAHTCEWSLMYLNNRSHLSLEIFDRFGAQKVPKCCYSGKIHSLQRIVQLRDVKSI